MTSIDPNHGIGTLVNHVAEGGDPLCAHIAPIYQTSTFRFPDVDTGAARFRGEEDGYIYTRYDNPNLRKPRPRSPRWKGLDLLRAQPGKELGEIVGARMFASGMAAITAAILARVKSGGTIVAQESLYGATYNFLRDVALAVRHPRRVGERPVAAGLG